MADIEAWERQLEHELAGIRRSSAQLANAIAAVRGRSEGHGVLVEVNADGDITTMQIAPAAMHWSRNQLSTVLIDCHRKARAEAKARVERILAKADPRLGRQLPQHREPPPAARAQLTEEEIQRADDEYFERMNRDGWSNTC
ncbi:YbaB/EbfC family nucleoid-associated protein [Nocardia brasiliensis]|uniref:YbaB/EbfC DNA-binding family protein n=1 Tax=Nocardia brasiliensis (strain ATCC 700358 / HUJEG-1) TaxID=1133849 RepID=K0ESA3_NOCB7|nr:YbaB/EbfC family nucleoid-associated protein [Nocardia brasiliensis]AFT99938.1 hypothetical protein O3I_009890 [Nocardia brasiliensis ATCC 700358]OCF87334.1 hypothetical protein AW168_25485 [Nocardia brasiliensis]